MLTLPKNGQLTVELEIQEKKVVTQPPEFHHFPNLPSIGGEDLGKWGWFLMDALDNYIMAIFVGQGYGGPVEHYLCKYRTFLEVFYDCVPSLTWLDHLPRLARPKTIVNISDGLDCPFMINDLYVPAGFGKKMIALAKLGICKAEYLRQGLRVARRWNDTIVSAAEVKKVLR